MPRDERNRKRRNRQSGAPRANQQAHKQVEQPKKQETPKSQPQQKQTVQKATVPRQTSATRAQRQTHKRFDSPRTQSPGRTASTTTNVSRPVRNRSIETRTQRQTHKIYNEPTNVRDSSVRTDRRSRERYQQRRAERSRVNEGRAAQHFLHEEAEAVKRGAKGAVRGWKNTIEDLPRLAGVSATDDASIKVQAMRMGQNPHDKKFTDRLKEIRTEESTRKAEARAKRVAQQQKEQAEFEERTKNDSALAKAAYGATESLTGMAADYGLGAVLGAATGGSASALSLGALVGRSYGQTRGTAEAEGATEEEDTRNALAQGLKEGITERILGAAGAPAKAYGKGALSFSDKLANKLTGNLTGKAADFVGAGVKYGGGIAEENIEEALGWLADPVISEVTYQKGVRERRQKQIKAQMQEESDALRAQITSEQSARAAAAYLSSDDFIQQSKKQYADSGLSEKKSLKMAEQMRDYLTASLIGDTDSMEKIEQEMATTMTGKGLSKDSWDVKELFDTVAATTVLTASTGLPGTVSSAYQGATLKENLGDEGIKALAKTAVDFDDPEIAEKAQVMSDRLDEGKGITDTQAYELKKATEEQQRKDTQRVASSLSLAKERIDADNLLDPYTVTRDGNIVFSKQMQTVVNENVKSAKTAIKTVNKEFKDDVKLHLSTAQVNAGASAIAHFQAGVMTISDANNLTYGNKVVRQVFQEQTGVDLEEFVVKGKDGKINIPATNAATKDALFARATENLVASAQAETVEWMDHTKGDVVDDISARMGAQGSLAVQQTLDDIDERDRDTYMLHANAADLVYQTARNMGTEWDTVKDNYTKMFPGISESKLQSMYEAGLADRSAAEDTARGRAVEIGKSLSETGEQETATGQVFVETKEPPKGTVIRLFSELANNLGADIHLVDHLGTAVGEANGAYDPNTNTFYINVNNAPETNLGYIFMHEVTHYLRVHAPEEYLALENLVREKWFDADSGGMQSAIAAKIAQYKGEQTLTEDQALEEIIADSAHEFLNDENFAKQVAEENPTLAKAMLDAIKRVLRVLRRMFWVDGIDDTQMDSLFSQLDIMTEAEALWLDAYKTAVRNRGNAAIDEMQDRMVRESIGEGGVRLSLSKDSEGNELSEGQREFFANSKAVDDDGRLLRLYHGTSGAGFTEFRDVRDGNVDGYEPLIWMTTSRMDANAYGGNIEDKFFDQNEPKQSDEITAGDYNLSDINSLYADFRFDTDEDRQEFLDKHPTIGEVKSQGTLDDMWDSEELSDEDYDELSSRYYVEDEKIRNDYWKYETLHTKFATVKELLENPDQFTRDDAAGAFLTWDKEGEVLEEHTKEDILDAIREGVENNPSLGDLKFRVRLRAGETGRYDTHHKNRTYPLYANLVNPMIVDAHGEHMEDGYHSYVAEMRADDQYDGIIIKNVRVGAYKKIGDVVISKYKENVKDVRNLNPTDSPDIRYSVSDQSYMDAVNRGDMETAQRMVDEAAKRAGYDIETFHGTYSRFNRFKNNSHFGTQIYQALDRLGFYNDIIDEYEDDPEVGELLSRAKDAGANVMRLYIKASNPIETSDFGDWSYDYLIRFLPEHLPNADIDWSSLNNVSEVVSALKAEGFDSIVYENMNEGRDEDEGDNDAYILFDPHQAKLADPVTYAEDGSVIPLSERFDPSNPDIRYSMPTQDSEGNTLTNGQMEFFKDSQARDRDGKLVVVYHTTNSGGFTVFDPSHSDDKRSIFFASNFKVSQTYGDDDAYNAINTDSGEPQHGYYMCYLNLKNPLIVDGKHSEWNEIPYGENEDGAEPAYTTHVFLDSEWDDDGNRTEYNLYGSFTDLSTGETHNIEPLTLHFPSDIYESGDRGAVMNFEEEATGEIYNRLLEAGMPIELADSFGWVEEDPMTGNIAMVGGYDEDGDYIDDMNRVSTRDLAEIAESEGYDGVIIRDIYDIAGMLSTEDALSDIYIAFSGEQIKDIRNENPTDDPDIRFSIPSEKEAKDYIASRAEDINDIPLSDPLLEENRVRYAISKDTFVNSVRNRWSEGWGELEDLPQDIPKAEKSLRMIMREVRRNSGTKKQYKSETLKDVLKDVKQMHKLLRKGSAEEFANLAWTAAEKIVDDIDYNDDMYTKYAEVRKYLDKTVITVPEELMTDDDFVEFCRDQEGFIRFGTEGTSLDDAYNWLSEKHPDMFPSEVEDPVDKIMQIAEVLDYTTPYREVYSSEEYANLVSDVANNLCSLVENSRDYKTTVDKLKVDAMNQRHQEALRKVTQKYEQKLSDMNHRHQEALRKADEKLEQVREHGTEQTEKQRQRAEMWKERYNERVQQNIRERKERKEKQEHKKKFDRIVKNYNELCKWVLEPTKEKNVPEEFRKVIAEFLQTLDLQTENSKKLEEKTGHAAFKTLRMRELKDKLKAFAEGKTESDGSYVPGGFELDAYASYILDMLSDEYDGKPVDSLDATAIGHVDTLLRTIMHNVKRYRQIKTETRTIPLQDIGKRSVEFLKAKINRDGVYGKRRGALGALETINTSALTPAYLFDRLGPLKEMYDVLRHNGFDKYIRNERVIIDKLNEILGKYNKVDRKGRNKPGSEIEKWRNDSEAVTVELTNGQSVTMSVAQVMSLYCLAKRGEQALGHMMVGGIVVTPIQTGSKIEASKEKLGIKRQNGTSEKYVLAYEDIQNIISKLSSDQKSVADQLQKFMSEDMAKLGNEAHRELYGYDMFNEKNYFPIKVHGNERPTDINTIGDVIEKIKSFGFTKPLTPKAGQAIEIDDIFSVVADHCNGMNLYNAYLVPITDFMKVFNYSHLFENGESLTMKEAIAQAYGSDILKYIMNLIKDVNGIKGENRGGLEGLMNRALGTAKRTAVFGNIRVALQQPTAILRAAAEISPKYLMKALNPKNVKGLMPGATTADMEEMWKYCPISQWKAWGYYDTYMGRDIEDVMMNNWSIGDTMLAGYYGQLDNLTWSMIWQAVKAEQADLHPKMDTKSEEFLNLCGRRASEVFDKTQVVDSTFHRSDAMRSPQVATKVFTAFMAEPTLTLNVFRAGLFHASELFKSGDKAKAIGVLNKTFSVIIAQAILVAAAQAVADAWREKDPGLPWDDDDDDDKEKAGYFERFLHNFVYNVFNNLHLENNMYLVKDVTPYLNYMISQGADYMGWNPTLRAVMGWDQDYLYSQNNLVFAGLENTANGVAQFFKKLSKGDDYKDYNTGEPKKWYDIIQKIASGVGTFTGIPLGTLMRDAKPIIKKLIPEVYAADLDFMNQIFTRGDSEDTTDGGNGSGMSDKDINAKVDAYRDGLSDEFDDDQKKKLTKQYEKSLRASTGTTEEKPEEDFDYQMELRSLKATEKATGKTGVEKDEVLWDVISDGYSKYIEDGDMESVQAMKDVYLTHGGSEEYFDKKVVTKMQSIYKKTIFSETESDEENLQKQDMMRRYMLDHGVTAEELSEMCYKTYTASDLKAALRMGNEKYIMDELIPLVRAGLSRDDFEKLVKYQNYGAKTYDGKYSDPKYRKSTGNLVWPTQGQITSEFGYRNAPTAGASSNHPAIDIGASQGSPVVAADGGKVISAGNAGGYGNQVAIQHDNGMVTYYSHLYSWNVKVGDTVAQGQQVGQVGSTGISTGPHLDFKVEVNGEPVNPLEYLSR